MFEYFKSKLTPRGVLFAQTTHSTKAIEQKWKVKLNALIFHLHGNSSSCGVFIAFFGSKSVTIAQNISDNNDRILLL